MYWDANNLYGFAMCQYLPYKGFKFIETCNKTLKMVLATSDTSDTGYTLEINCSYPREVHDKLKEFVPAPGNIKPDIELFSEYQKEIGTKTGAVKNDKHLGAKKKVPRLLAHKNYVEV